MADKKGDLRPSFDIRHVQSKIVRITSGSWHSSGFFARIEGKPYIVTVEHGINPRIRSCTVVRADKSTFIPSLPGYFKADLDLALFPLTTEEAARGDFFDIQPAPLLSYLGRTVRIVGFRSTGGYELSSGALSHVDDEEEKLEIDTQTEKGQSGSVNVVDLDQPTVLGMHLGGRALRVAHKEMANVLLNDATDEQLGALWNARLLSAASFGGARAESLSVNGIVKAHREYLKQPAEARQGSKACAGCTSVQVGKFCQECGARRES